MWQMRRPGTVALGLLVLCITTTAAPEIHQGMHPDTKHHQPVQLTVHAEVLGMEPHQLQQILDLLANDKELYEHTNDHSFDTLLENFFNRLLRYLHKKKKLPVDLFGREPDLHKAKSFRSNWTHAPHLPRESINRFWAAEKDNIIEGSKCLEHFPSFYASSNSRCKEAWTLDYEADHSKARVEDEKKTIYDDLANFANSHMYDHFDVIVATQVLELPSNPYRVAHTWYKLLKPGGLLLTTQPFIERDVRPVTGWPDHFRFTDIGVESVLKHTGFEIDAVYLGGNSLLTTGFMMGYGTHDFSPRELEATLNKRGVDYVEDVYYNTMVVARKPVNNAM